MAGDNNYLGSSYFGVYFLGVTGLGVSPPQGESSYGGSSYFGSPYFIGMTGTGVTPPPEVISAYRFEEGEGVRYGDPYRYNRDPLFRYGQSITKLWYSFPMPKGLVAAPLIMNRISGPSVTWHEGVDYRLNFENGTIDFRINPFDADFAQRARYDASGEYLDRDAGLWLFGAQFDEDRVYQHHGYILDIKLPTSARYRDLLNALFDGIVEGGHYNAVANALGAITDAPLVKYPAETIVEITKDSRSQLILTDLNVYRAPLAAKLRYAAGDSVQQGDSLTEAMQIFEFHRGVVPEGLLALTLGRDFLGDAYHEGLTFENKTFDTTVTVDNGLTRVEFPLGGWPSDVAKFWETLHQNGVTNGQTFADLLDQRPTPVGHAPTGAVPTKINPLKFLAENVLRSNAFLVLLKPAQFGADALPLKALRFLRRLIPPHTAMIILAQLEAADEPIIMEGPGGPEAPGYEEDVSPYIGGEPFLETLSTAGVSETTELRYVDGVCL